MQLGPTAPSPALELVSVSRAFGARRVLDGVGLAMAAGERVGVRGPNGSGKTTLLRCVAGTLAPTAGRVLVGGHRAGSVAARRLTGVCGDLDRAFYRRLTGYENLLIFARLRWRPAVARRAAAEVVAELELGELANAPVERCSAGMVGQLALGRALLGASAVLVLDEPTRSLDADARERLWAALGRRPQLACLVASHRADDLERCDRVVALGD